MTLNNPSPRIHSAPLTRHLLVGAIIGLALISVFLYGADNTNPEWPTYWRARPMLIVPVAGAMGGLCWYLLDHLRAQGGTMKVLANILAVVIFIVGIWMGMVLGLDGTHWD